MGLFPNIYFPLLVNLQFHISMVCSPGCRKIRCRKDTTYHIYENGQCKTYPPVQLLVTIARIKLLFTCYTIPKDLRKRSQIPCESTHLSTSAATTTTVVQKKTKNNSKRNKYDAMASYDLVEWVHITHFVAPIAGFVKRLLKVRFPSTKCPEIPKNKPNKKKDIENEVGEFCGSRHHHVV